MNLIQDFYINLDSLELIIFWGIILVVILTIILIIIVINKKKKTKEIIEDNYIEELPINIEKLNEEPEEILENITEETNLLEEIEPIIEIEKETSPIVDTPEEPIFENKEEPKEENKYKTTFEMPTAPYQRNVLREMSLSQTSPIGINRKEDYIKPQDLFEMYNKPEETIEIPEIREHEEPSIEELTKESTKFQEETENDNFDIERTRYEIEQEENAIISYKELMEKKDSIQTIDEEDAVISIEELLNKTNQKDESKEETKLYNISETEENDSFINELKQFRKDL